MILANLRERISATDVDLVVKLLARGDPGRKLTLQRVAAGQGIDVLLDEPRLSTLLRDRPQHGSPSPALFIYVVVRHTLRAVGIDDARLSDYLGALIFEFGLRDRAHRISRSDDEVYHYLADILADVESVPGRRGFLLRAHLGNFSLWLAGIFPDYITAREERKGGPGLGYYEELGAHGFRLAAHHRLARQLDLADIYARAAESFPVIRVALNRLSDRLFFPNVATPGRLLRQVADEFRLGNEGTTQGW
ncbi:MAG: hypothetical protein GTN62_13950 [Gemmatimonadales bacterium]|nr:hypothetical protein [Gemmatimonadales bacterium]NIN13106.1 hypothetical protein [Gemmatimonadales bacterium]NIN51190.1 hypothetical protein [Gemmatimonadales bacterium]NIP08654.1 hypothetical protein [Gemmatimonadales bacterium]NIR02342.1 hypothetical protein [Gemmatimonadales bacterium]